ncbi:MAG: FtsX-like permease family protein, partial [Clostridiales bacterium]|nr:FtsX-like permease family protein [Clostridiales bacterium]
AIVLLLENVCYALMGSIPAIVLYMILRDPMMSTLFQTTNGYGEAVETIVHPISVLVVAGVVAGCILVECVLPLKAVLSATGTPIRDIIFDNRDTAYVLKKRSVITGCIFLAVTVVLGIFHKNLYCVVGFVVTTVVTLALLTPVLISGVSKGLQKMFQKTGNMSWELASREMRARKSTVGSAVLCATSAAICVTILAYGLETLDNFIPPVYDCDAIIDISTEGDKLFYVENLDGVSDVEYSYVSYMEILVNGEKDDNSTVKGMPDGGFRMVHEYSGLPDSLPAGTIAVRSEYARKYKLDTGDTLTLTVDPDGIFPLEREFVITCLYDMTGGYKSDNVFIIGMDDFEDIFGDEPSTIYVRCSDPQGVIDTVEKYSSMYTGYYTMTIEDYIEETNGEAGPVITGLIVIIVIGAGMTCIGTASNQIIGFEGRKRECAVMLSTSMNKKKLSGILFKEVLIASFVSSVAGCFSGILLVKAVNSAFEDMGLLSFTSAEVKPVLLFTLVLALVFTLTVVFPIGHLRKMQLSEQLKYE